MMPTSPSAKLTELLQTTGLRLGTSQRRRLDWLADRAGPAQAQRPGEAPDRDAGLVIVTEPMSGAGAELFCSALPRDCVVVLPFGENPDFDFLKSKLTEFGTVGPCGAEGPHEMWWGGVGDAETLAADPYETARPRIVSCYQHGCDDLIWPLQQAAQSLGLAAHISPLMSECDDRLLAYEKAEFILQAWEQFPEPLLYIEAGALLQAPPLLPAQLECDVALHRWNRWELSARTLYFGRSEAAKALLLGWRRLAKAHPTVWDGYLLDQAWSLALSRSALDTVWLPRSYHTLHGDPAQPSATIVHDLPGTSADLGPDAGFASLVRTARRAGRTGGRDALVVMTSHQASGDGVAVILRDIAAADSRVVATTVETTTSAFAADNGGFGRLELMLCAWRDEVDFAREAATSARLRVAEIVPGQPIPHDFFAKLDRQDAETPSLIARGR